MHSIVKTFFFVFPYLVIRLLSKKLGDPLLRGMEGDLVRDERDNDELLLKE